MPIGAPSFRELEEDFLRIVASWVDDEQEKEEVWEVFLETPQPLGRGPEGMAGYGPDEWRNPIFTLLRLDPWRVQVMRGEEYPRGTLTGAVWYGQQTRAYES